MDTNQQEKEQVLDGYINLLSKPTNEEKVAGLMLISKFFDQNVY